MLRGGKSTDAAPVIGAEGSAVVNLRFNGLSPMYMGYFAEPSFVGGLGAGLGHCTQDPVDVVVSYDMEQRQGTILVSTAPRSLGCVPKRAGKGWDLSGMTAVGRALSGYRDELAAFRDFRISNFQIGVAYLRGAHLCTLYYGGQFPPDGSAFSPCVDLAGVKHCATGDAESVTQLVLEDAEADAYLATCFGG